MKKLILFFVAMAWIGHATAQTPVTVIGAMPKGDCIKVFSTTQITDAGGGGDCSGIIGGVYNTKALAAAATIPSTVTTIYIKNYASTGDGGEAYYFRTTDPCSTVYRFNSADGACWQIIPVGGSVNVLQFGGDATGASNSTTAITNTWTTAVDLKAELHFIANPTGGNTYKFTAGLNLLSSRLTVRAMGRINLQGSGSGNQLKFDTGSSVEEFNFLGDFKIIGDLVGGATNCLSVSQAQHIVVQTRVWSCATGVTITHSILSEFTIVSSINEESSAPAASISASGTTGAGVTFTASAPVFDCTTAGYVGQTIFYSPQPASPEGGRAVITTCNSSTVVTATVLRTLDNVAKAQGSWGLYAIPTVGIQVDRLAPGFETTSSNFRHTIEGLNGKGVYIAHGNNNTFIGSSESNEYGYYTETGNIDNLCISCHAEGNWQADAYDNGQGTRYASTLMISNNTQQANVILDTAAAGISFTGGLLRVVSIDAAAKATSFVGVGLRDGALAGIQGTGPYSILSSWTFDGNFGFVAKVPDKLQQTEIIFSGSSSLQVASGASPVINTTTNPVLNVDSSVSSDSTGINIIGEPKGTPPIITVTSSATDEALDIYAKGAGITRLGFGSTGNVVSSRNFNVSTLSTAGVVTNAVTTGQLGSIQGSNGNILRWATGAAGFGSIDLSSSNAVGVSKLGLANGGTNADLSATGGASQVLRQSSAGAAITVSALTPGDVPLTSAHILVGNGSNVAADVAVTGDVSINNSGVTTVSTLTTASSSANSNFLVTFAGTSAGSNEAVNVNTNLIYNPSTAIVTLGGSTPFLKVLSSGSQGNFQIQNNTSGTGSTDGFLLQFDGSDAFLLNYENGRMFRYTNGTLWETLSSAGAFRWHAYTTPGTLQNDASGNIASVAGLSVTKTVRAAGGIADCTLIFTLGVLTGGSC